MKRYFYSFLVVLVFTISCQSNGSNDNLKNSIIEKFYKAYSSQDLDQIAEISDNSISDMLKNIVSDNFEHLGKNISHTQYSKKNIKKGGVKHLVFTFESKFEKSDEPIFEKFFINTKTNKISSYVYSGNKEFIDNYETYSQKCTEVTFSYYDNLIKNDLSILDKILDKNTSFGDTIIEKYIQVIKDRKESYGKIVSYSQINTNTFFNGENVTVIQRFVCQTDKEIEVYEELRLIDEEGEFKIYDYYYAPDYQTLISE